MGYHDRHESGGGSNAVLVVAIVLALLLGVPLVLGVVLVFLGGLFFVGARSEMDSIPPIPIAESGPADPAAAQTPPEAKAPPRQPPSIEQGSEQGPQSLEITIDEMGQLKVDGMGITADDLPQWIEERFGDPAEGVSATILANRKAKYLHVARVLSLLTEAGVEQVQVRQADASAESPTLLDSGEPVDSTQP